MVVAFAARAALRGLPGLGGADDATIRDIALPVVRAILVSTLAAKVPSAKVTSAANSAAQSADLVANGADFSTNAAAYSAKSAAYSAATSASYSTSDSVNCKAYSVNSIAYFANSAANSASSVARVAANSAAFAAITIDANGPLASANATAVFDLPLWDAVAMPEGLAKNLDALRAFWGRDPQVWGFWARWYEGFLTGKPLDWGLQEKIALIDPDKWEKGPERIAELIAEIEARHELLSKISALEGQVATFRQLQRGIGDNNPPEPIDHITQLPESFEVIWEPLQDIKAEAQKTWPNKDKIGRSVQVLISILAATGKWTAGKADKLVDATIKPLGVTLCATFVAWVTGHADTIVAVIQAAKAWLHLL